MRDTTERPEGVAAGTALLTGRTRKLSSRTLRGCSRMRLPIAPCRRRGTLMGTATPPSGLWNESAARSFAKPGCSGSWHAKFENRVHKPAGLPEERRRLTAQSRPNPWRKPLPDRVILGAGHYRGPLAAFASPCVDAIGPKSRGRGRAFSVPLGHDRACTILPQVCVTAPSNTVASVAPGATAPTRAGAPYNPPRHVPVLDGMRGLAVLMVLVFISLEICCQRTGSSAQSSA